MNTKDFTQIKPTEFLEAIYTELKTLKSKVTEEQLVELCPGIEPLSNTYCLYGQLTGNASSAEAMELYDYRPFCFVHEKDPINDWVTPGDTFEALMENNKKFKKKVVNNNQFTPLEIYLGFEIHHDEILNYIKGNIDSINLTIPTR
tara:strand:+ start:121 stop:558 length:438 start_codon:yes stop_codon:yes gene_type:complete